jgi:hypothetical protein
VVLVIEMFGLAQYPNQRGLAGLRWLVTPGRTFFRATTVRLTFFMILPAFSEVRIFRPAWTGVWASFVVPAVCPFMSLPPPRGYRVAGLRGLPTCGRTFFRATTVRLTFRAIFPAFSDVRIFRPGSTCVCASFVVRAVFPVMSLPPPGYRDAALRGLVTPGRTFFRATTVRLTFRMILPAFSEVRIFRPGSTDSSFVVTGAFSFM